MVYPNAFRLLTRLFDPLQFNIAQQVADIGSSSDSEREEIAVFSHDDFKSGNKTMTVSIKELGVDEIRPVDPVSRKLQMDSLYVEQHVAKESIAPARIAPSTIANLPPTLRKFTLTGKVAVVTGGARSLGFQMAQALAEVGVGALAIFDVLQDLGVPAAAELQRKCGIPVRFYTVDVRDSAAIASAVEDVVHQFGNIDVLIHAAGVNESGIPAEDVSPVAFRRLLDINLTGSFLVSQACGRVMLDSGRGGSIILIASMSGTIVNIPQEQACYNASKAGVIQLGKSLASEWAKNGIRVNCISPGYMETPPNHEPHREAQLKLWMSRTPQQRLGDPDELNNLAVFLASDASTYMTGSNCIIDGGYSLW